MRTRRWVAMGVALLVLSALLSAPGDAGGWDKQAWLKKLEAAKKAEGTLLIQYDNQPNYANWGGIVGYFEKQYGVKVPPDMKGSGPTLAALLKEREATPASVAYYNALVGAVAGQKGVHQPYKPIGWEKIPADCKDPEGLWFCVHEATMAFIVNTKALEKAGAPVPKSWRELLDPKYKGLVGYDDPTIHGTAWEVTFAANLAMGGDTKNLRPGIDYLKKLHPNIVSYSRETSYNAALRGEIAVWLHADGSGYKMKHVDGGPVEVVIPEDGTGAVPLNVGLVKWAKHPKLAQAYLDWLVSPEAQGIWADSFWKPIIADYMTDNARQKMKPLHGSYNAVKRVPILEKEKIYNEYRALWAKEVRQQ